MRRSRCRSPMSVGWMRRPYPRSSPGNQRRRGMAPARAGYGPAMPSREAPRAVRVPMVRQEWRMVAFVHWPVPVDELAPAVPSPLTLDTLDGYAWLTLTPFSTTCEVLGTLPVPGP